MDLNVTLTQHEGYQFDVDFGIAAAAPLRSDAQPPLGEGRGPDAERLLMAAVGNCLSASLLFALRKFGNEVGGLRTTVSATLARNAQGRLRVGGLAVDIHLAQPASSLRLLDRALAQYEDFCVVTQSVRAGVPVAVRVFDGLGQRIAPAAAAPAAPAAS